MVIVLDDGMSSQSVSHPHRALLVEREIAVKIFYLLPFDWAADDSLYHTKAIDLFDASAKGGVSIYDPLPGVLKLLDANSGWEIECVTSNVRAAEFCGQRHKTFLEWGTRICILEFLCALLEVEFHSNGCSRLFSHIAL
ncbi:hypothetical protein GMOD_00006951 [Pyrenophora seminiperda CCB06]|uniref:Uncharacterized protein n=1 Tax=Pyrenophora seminiperda CCB06 TaxID=1302712 RepID=A0A3M7MBX4_9PLEO|nr:hypothetical protein GMOD_00006951 [Pyrenophora seminiperda CCB06]